MIRLDPSRLSLLVAAALLTGAAPLSGQAASPADHPEAAASVDEGARALWVAGALDRVLSERDYATILLTAAVGRAFSDEGPDALNTLGPILDVVSAARSPSGIRAPTGGVAAGLVACGAAETTLDGALCSIERLVPLASPAVARALTEEGAGLVDQYFRPASASTVEGSVAALGPARGSVAAAGFDPLQALAARALEDIWGWRFTPAATGPEPDGGSALSLDAVLTELLGVDPADASDRLLGEVSGIRALLEEHPLLSPLDAGQRALDDVMGEYRSFLGEITGSIGAGLADLPDESGWASHRSFVYLAAQSAALAGADESITERILTLGSAAVDLRRGASEFAASLSSVGRDAALGALTGNVLGIASGITAFFGLTPGALGFGAADEVRALREGIEDLGREVDAGFEGVDGQFALLFGTLDDRFGRLEALVLRENRAVQADIAALHEEITALGARIERAEDALRTYVEAGFDREYSRTLVRCLEHRSRFLPPFDEMDFATFSGCVAEFRVRAVRDARDGLMTDLSTLVDDASLAAALSDSSIQNLARRLPLMSRAAVQRFGHTGLRGDGGLANPIEWAVAAEAYLTLLADWPEHARAVAPGDLEAIRSVGIAIRDGLESVPVTAAPGSADSLLHRVLAYYDVMVEDLTREADLLARRHRQAGLLRVPPETLLSRLEPTADPGPSLPVPPVLATKLPREVRTAAVLALGDATLTYRLASQDSVYGENERRHRLIFGKRHDRLTYTRTRLVAEVRFGNLRTVSTHWVDGPWVLRRTEEMDGEIGAGRSLNTVEHVPNPEGRFLAEDWPGLANDPVAWVHTPPRAEAVASLEAQIEAELRRYATAALNGVFREVCTGASAGITLDAEDEESARRIGRALDGLSAARALLAGLMRVSMSPLAVTRVEDVLHGPEGLLDRGALCNTVSAGESALRTVWLEEEPGRRADLMRAALGDVLENHQASAGGFELVGSTLAELDAAIRVQRLRTMVARADP